MTDHDILDAARLLLSRMDVDPAALAAETPARSMPTFDTYIPAVAEAVTDATRRAYNTYWELVRREWGTRQLNEPTPTEIQQLAKKVKDNAAVRSNSHGGRGQENFLAALRCVYRHAELAEINHVGGNTGGDPNWTG